MIGYISFISKKKRPRCYVQSSFFVERYLKINSVFPDRPKDPWSWFSAISGGSEDPTDKLAWSEIHPMLGSNGDLDRNFNDRLNSYLFPALQDQHWERFFEIRRHMIGKSNVARLAFRDSDLLIKQVAEKVQQMCEGSLFLFAVGDRCCAPQWGSLPDCRCKFPH